MLSNRTYTLFSTIIIMTIVLKDIRFKIEKLQSTQNETNDLAAYLWSCLTPANGRRPITTVNCWAYAYAQHICVCLVFMVLNSLVNNIYYTWQNIRVFRLTFCMHNKILCAALSTVNSKQRTFKLLNARTRAQFFYVYIVKIVKIFVYT